MVQHTTRTGIVGPIMFFLFAALAVIGVGLTVANQPDDTRRSFSAHTTFGADPAGLGRPEIDGITESAYLETIAESGVNIDYSTAMAAAGRVCEASDQGMDPLAIMTTIEQEYDIAESDSPVVAGAALGSVCLTY